MAQALQSAQKSLQNAGQEQAGQSESTEEEMGQEFRPGGSQSSGKQGSQGQGQGAGSGSQPGKGRRSGSTPGSGTGQGMGGPGIGAGGGAGTQQPLPGVKQDKLFRGTENPNGRKLSRSFKGLPDPTQDKAAYYQVNGEARRAAEASMNREPIPSGYQKAVKTYFEQIQSQ